MKAKNNEIEKILEDIFDYGYTTKELNFGKLSIVIRNTLPEDYEFIHAHTNTHEEVNNDLVLQRKIIYKLACNIIKYKNKEYSKEELIKLLNNLAIPVLYKIVDGVNELDKKVNAIINNEKIIEENFFDVGGSQKKVEL